MTDLPKVAIYCRLSEEDRYKSNETDDHGCRYKRKSDPLQKDRPFALLAVSQLIFTEFQII